MAFFFEALFQLAKSYCVKNLSFTYDRDKQGIWSILVCTLVFWCSLLKNRSSAYKILDWVMRSVVNCDYHKFNIDLEFYIFKVAF